MSKQIQDAYIVAATRTPVGKAPRGYFRNTRPDELLAHVLRSVVAQAPGIDLSRIDDAIIGCAMPEAEQGMNVARIGVLLAGLPNTVAAQTINRFCSSGLQAVALAADQIRLGNADLILAGGTESMSMVPMMGHRPSLSPSVFENENIAIAYGMGITAEKVSEEWKVSREDQDAFALASHQKALAAQAAGEFKDEITPYQIVSDTPDLVGGTIKSRRIVVENDEGPRADTTAEGLAKLRTVFRAGGTVTAGNSSQMSDGAAGILLASEQAIKDYGLTPLARFVSFSVAGVRPEVMGIGPIAAIPKALKQGGLTRMKTPATDQTGSKPLWVRGHEFHYAREDDGPLPPHCAPLWQLHDSKGTLLRQEGCRCGSVAGTWLHCYPEGSRTFWRAWLKTATPPHSF